VRNIIDCNQTSSLCKLRGEAYAFREQAILASQQNAWGTVSREVLFACALRAGLIVICVKEHSVMKRILMKQVRWRILAAFFLTFFGMEVATADVNAGLVGYWPFDGNALDASGNGNNGTVYGATLAADRFGNPSSAYSFDGIDDYIQTLNNGPTVGNAEYSIAIWVKPDVQLNNEGWVFDPRGGIYDGRYYAQIRVLGPEHHLVPNRLVNWVFDGTCLNCPAGDPDSGQIYFRDPTYPQINDNQWHHIVFIGDNLNDLWMLYVDGDLIETHAKALGDTSVVQPIRFGGEQYDNRPPRYKGMIDDVRIYDRALTPAEIGLLYAPPPQLACEGFEPPMDTYPVTAKGDRALPLKAQLFDAEGYLMTNTDIAAAPVLQVVYDSGNGEEPIDVTDDALPAGQGTDGNLFVFTDDLKWQYNLKAKNYSAIGTYTINMVSGDDSEYVMDPGCVTSFVRK